MVQGVVKWVNAATGFGCIAPTESDTELFISLHSVETDLQEGQTVFFDIKNTDCVTQAINVRLSDEQSF